MIILGILLALSVAGNAWQYHEHTADSIKFGTTKQLADDTKAAASACSAGVDRMEKAGTTRQRALDAALKGIQPALEKSQRDVMDALKARPDDPKDLCGSLGRYLNQQIQAEKKAAGTP